MLLNLIKIGYRNLLSGKFYTVINIAGLSLGISCCLLLTLFIKDEFSYDKQHADLENLYRINSHFAGNVELEDLATCSPPIAPAMQNELPEIEASVRIISPPGVAQSLIKYNENIFYETDGYIADSTLFDIFTYEFVEGNQSNSLTYPNTVVITDKMADKLFGKEAALNKVITITQGWATLDFKITGVIKENKRSHLQANFFTSMTSNGWGDYLRSDRSMSEWAGQNFVISYVKLSPNANPSLVEGKMNEVLKAHAGEALKAAGYSKRLSLEPVKDIYLRSSVEKSPRITFIYIIATIAAFILVIACINFMNLATAKATKRANEIGLRKVMGAVKGSLVAQFLIETLILVSISVILGLLLLHAVLLDLFNDLTNKTVSINADNIGYFAGMLALVTLITSLFAGSYPAFYLSSFEPVRILKGKLVLSNSSALLRKGLVVFQFMIAIVLVSGMFLISEQLDFIQQKDLGFESNNRIIVPLRTQQSKAAYSLLKNELLKKSSINDVTAADYVPGAYWNDIVLYPSGSSSEKGVFHFMNEVENNFNSFMKIEMLAGRSFTPNLEQEQNNIIINRASATALGFSSPSEALNKIIDQSVLADAQGNKIRFHIIGVMEDFHQRSLKEPIRPLIFKPRTLAEWDQFENLLISLDNKNIKTVLSDVENLWKAIVQDTPFEYFFLEDNILKQYIEDQQLKKTITTFAFIGMFISCLGLLGLSSYMADRRVKEIGVRKVMGASTSKIIQLMSTEFLKLVGIAVLLSVPLGWYLMGRWLDGFAYRISISVFVFLYAGIAALLIALITVSFESIRAALANPVKSLRNE